MPRQFSPDRERTPEGYIIFPNDVPYRREHFCSDSFKHPAKAVCFLIEDLVDYLTQPGDVILDPMAGTGTLMLATLKGRRVLLIEDVPVFHWYQQQSKELFVRRGVPEEWITLLFGPCQDYLPIPGINHVIFSPPYANVLASKPKAQSSKALAGSAMMHQSAGEGQTESVLEDYLGSVKNLGRLPTFFYNMAMTQIYGLLLQCLIPGGTMTTIVQDVMRGGERISLTGWVKHTCGRLGFEFVEQFERYSPGTGFKKSHRARGHAVVDNESILIFRKPVSRG